MKRLSGTVEEKIIMMLREAGWYPGRKVSIDEVTDYFGRFGIELSAKAKDFIAEYYRIKEYWYFDKTETGRGDDFEFIFFPYPKSYCTDVKDFMYDDMDGVLESQEYKAVKDYDKIICMIGEIGYYYPARVWIGDSGRLFCTHEYDEEVLVFDDVIELIRYEVVIGAGAGLSTAAGFTYSGERFDRYFSDFGEKYGFTDMYSGGFYDFDTLEEYWAYWSRYVYVNRYMNPPKPLYRDIFELVKNKDYFVLTTNVDHCFQKAGFDKERMFYTQGDYGLFQCSRPCHDKTYDNEEIIKKMVLSQGFKIENIQCADSEKDGKTENVLVKSQDTEIKLTIPTELVPRCPKCGRPMSMNLRADNTFVQDDGWYMAADRYEKFMENYKGQKILFLELGVGFNTPGIIKYNFWKYAAGWKNAFYVCINKGEAYVPGEIVDKSVSVNEDISVVCHNYSLRKGY